MADNETSRLSAAEIFGRVTTGAEEEIARPVPNLAFSALGAGLAMGLSGLGVAVVQAGTGSHAPWTFALYPVGFVAVIVGRMQLFTENTLFPVALILEQRRHLGVTARLWLVVLSGNVIGTALFALLAVHTPALKAGPRSALVELGKTAGSASFASVFWSAVIGGWIIALVAWLVTASTDTVGQVLVILVLTFLVGAGGFTHSVAGSGEVLSAVINGSLPLSSYLTWLVGAVIGNAIGGVAIVALLNYGQVHGPSHS